jgi:hypothetical protein
MNPYPVRCALALLAAATLAGCATSAPNTAPAEGSPPPASGAQRLAGFCPDTIVLQDVWDPDANQAAEYSLIGPGYTIDADHKRVTGPLVAAGQDTGVKLEIRSGGAAIGFATVPAQMYLDKSITIGAVHTDLAIASSANQPVTAVVAPLTKSPLVLMWDPATHPDWHGIADIGRSGAKVVVAKDSFYAPLLVSKGLIKADQVDTGYTGAPARFVGDPSIAQQAYATSEPYIYQHEIPSWGKPVSYQLLADVGYSIYPEPLSVRTADLGPLSGCLRRLVPIVQQAEIDYLVNPGPTNRLLTEAVAKFNDGWTYSMAVADFAAATFKRLKLAANDTGGAVGGMDPARVQATINTFAPLLSSSGAAVKPGLTAADIATNQFLNPGIKLP